MPVPRGGLPGYDVTASGSLYARLVNTYDNGIAWLRLAMAVLTVAAAALVVEQKHLLAEPGPGLALVLLCVLPFIINAAWPYLLRPDWRLAAAMLAVFGGATALLAYRPADGDAAVLFFIALAAWVACVAGPRVSVPAGVLVVAVPAVASRLGGSHTPVLAAIGTPAGTLICGPAAQATQAASAMKNSTVASPSAGR